MERSEVARERRGVVSRRRRPGFSRREWLLSILASGLPRAARLPAVAGLATTLTDLATAQPARTTSPGSGRAPIARTAELPRASNLAADGARAQRERMPILLFFDRESCPYCEQALREYLVPMSREAWRDRALFRAINIDSAIPVTDFDGRTVSHRAVASRYRVSLSPTVMVVDPTGKLLASPIVGLLTVDFYGAYLEDALARAAERVARAS